MNRNIDILKYIMSVMIMLIHVGYSFDFPILRVAVPTFFIVSSYFFFKKVDALSPEESKACYRKFIVRGIKLYAFWLVVLLPYMIAVKYQTRLLAEYIVYFPLNLLLRSVFPASWYLAAYMICISLVYWGCRRVKLLVAIGAGLYAVCCLESNYGVLIDGILPSGSGYFAEYAKSLYISFPVGLVFVVIGKILAAREPRWQIALGALIVGAAGLAFEADFVVAHGLRVADDCYFSLMLFAPGLFLTVLKLPVLLDCDTTVLRRMSTINYCSHFAIIRMFSRAVHSGGAVFALTLVCCTLLGLTLIGLSKRIRVLRFAY